MCVPCEKNKREEIVYRPGSSRERAIGPSIVSVARRNQSPIMDVASPTRQLVCIVCIGLGLFLSTP